MMKNPIRVGLPRALLYHKYHVLWRTFLEALGCQVIISPETNRLIMSDGTSRAVDESCLPVKLFLGHVSALLNQGVDHLFIPRIVSLYPKETICVKFWALPDIVQNTFEAANILSYTVDSRTKESEWRGLMAIGWQVTHNPVKTYRAYRQAKQQQAVYHHQRLTRQLAAINQNSAGKPRILIAAHPYTTYDAFLGGPIVNYLESQGVSTIFADLIEDQVARGRSREISRDLYWTFHKELVGAIAFYRQYIDGLIFLMTFPCGPDSLVVNLCQNRLQGLPMAVITLDELQAEVGLKTRLESFVDILKIRTANHA